MTTTDVPVATPQTDEEWHAHLPERVHGSNDTYCTWKCRCSLCRRAHADHKRLYKPATAKLISQADTDWMKTTKKNCQGLDPNLFFPVGAEGTDSYLKAVAAAQEICEGCCVASECLEYAISTRQEGVWAGTDDRERRRIKRHRLKQARLLRQSVSGA